MSLMIKIETSLTKNELGILLDGLYIRIERLEGWLEEKIEFTPLEIEAIKAGQKSIKRCRLLIGKLEKNLCDLRKGQNRRYRKEIRNGFYKKRNGSDSRGYSYFNR